MAANLSETQWQGIVNQINSQEGLSLRLAPKIVYEIVIYALIIDNYTRQYDFFEVTAYTGQAISVADVFACIEQMGFRLQRREAGINRIEVNRLQIGRMPRTLPANRELVDDWCRYILDEVARLVFKPPKSGAYWRRRAGVSTAEYRARRRARAQERTAGVQEVLDRYRGEE